jgi:hypothetical protein
VNLREGVHSGWLELLESARQRSERLIVSFACNLSCSSAKVRDRVDSTVMGALTWAPPAAAVLIITPADSGRRARIDPFVMYTTPLPSDHGPSRVEKKTWAPDVVVKADVVVNARMSAHSSK